MAGQATLSKLAVRRHDLCAISVLVLRQSFFWPVGRRRMARYMNVMQGGSRTYFQILSDVKRPDLQLRALHTLLYINEV